MEPWLDFLPQEYRQRRRRLRRRWQQAALAVGVLGLAAVSVLWEQWRWRQLDRAVEQARGQLRVCQQEAQVLQEHCHKLHQLQAQAALCALLERGWSRSRTLAFLLHALPEEVRLVRVEFFYQKDTSVPMPERPARSGRSARGAGKNDSAETESDPVVEDLQQLRQEQQQRRLEVLIQGTAAGYEQVQRLMAQLRTISALERLQLLEVESDEEGRLAFRIQGRFRPEFPGSSAGEAKPAGDHLPTGSRPPRGPVR